MRLILLWALLALTTVVTAQNKKMKDDIKIIKGNIVRISIGYFDPQQADKVESMLQTEFKNSLIPAIKKLKGNLGYHVGIDREKHTMTNVSFWDNIENAKQMSTLKEMLAMRATFEALGLKFIDITNHDILWKLPE
jgi:quinol monooxygenase YgiN